MWILTNRKPVRRRGLVQLIDASSFWRKMRRSLGSKRKEMSEEYIAAITRLFGECVEADLAVITDAEGKTTRQILRAGETPPAAPEGGRVKVVPLSRLLRNETFGYRQIVVERPLRDEAGRVVLGNKGKQKGKPLPDPALRDTERVPLDQDVAEYMRREVLPHAPDAWVGRGEDEGRLRDPVQPVLLRVRAAAALGGDRCRVARGDGTHQSDVGRPRSMSLRPYPAYRDSGVPWIGKVPSHGLATPLKRVVGFSTGWTPPTGRDDLYEGPHAWATIGDMSGRVINDTAKTISDEAVRLSGIRPSSRGSLLFSFKLSIGQVCFAGRDMYTNEAIATFLPGDAVDLDFAYYAFPLFLTANAAENIYGAKLLNQELIRNAKLVLPPLAEQRAIAAFLDRECGRLDTLITEAERAIVLLKERRAALISAAVTGKIDVRGLVTLTEAKAA